MSSLPLEQPESWPAISIVTPSFNQAAFLEATIQSILSQNYPRLQYLVIDGGSTDGSIDVIKKYAASLDYWVSEKDRGQSHAINKGLARCTGEIFNWINSDDLLMPGALHAVARAWQRTPGRIIAGHTEFFNEHGTFEIAKASGQTLRNFVRFWEARDWGWAQQGTFVPRAALQAVGGIREDLKYCLDYHMMVQLLAAGCEVTCLEQTLGRFRFHGTSKTVGSKEEFRLERVPTLRAMKHLPVPVEDWEWDGEQARRLVDAAFSAAKRGKLARGATLLAQSLRTSPRAAVREVAGRGGRRLVRARA